MKKDFYAELYELQQISAVETLVNYSDEKRDLFTTTLNIHDGELSNKL